MKKIKKTKKSEKQIVEIHIYIHNNSGVGYIPPVQPNTYPNNPITNPPYYVTCGN